MPLEIAVPYRAPAKPVTPDFVWEMLTREHFSGGDSISDVCERWGYDISIIRTREYMKLEAELHKEYLKHLSLAQMTVAQVKAFELVKESDRVNPILEFHRVAANMAGMGAEQGAAAGSGFVLNINVPGAPITISSQSAPRPASSVEDAEDIDSTPTSTSTPTNVVPISAGERVFPAAFLAETDDHLQILDALVALGEGE